MIVSTLNNENVKIQGPMYYADCYKWWDLNKSKEAFDSQEYKEKLNNINNCHPFSGDLAVIDFSKYSCYKNYYAKLSKNVKRDIKKSKNIHTFKEFCFNDFIPDFLEINHSQKKLKGSINPWYLNSASYFDGSHCGDHEWQDEKHFSKWFGLFKYLKHYKQFDKTTNEKLMSYCKLCVDGEFACIHLFFSHANYLKFGLSFHIISSIIEYTFGLDATKCLVYGGMGQYPEWKSRMLFSSHKVKLVI